MKKIMAIVLSLIMLTVLCLTLGSPAYAAVGSITLTKEHTSTSVDINGNYLITYLFTVQNTSHGIPPGSLTLYDVYIDDFIHGTKVGDHILTWTSLAEGATVTGSYTYTVQPGDIDTNGSDQTVTNIAWVHSHASGSTTDIKDDDDCTVTLPGPTSSVPEIPAIALLGVGLAGVGTVIFIQRKKSSGKTTV